jgi:hypothetical protein
MERDEVDLGEGRLQKFSRFADMNNDDQVFMMRGGKMGPLLGMFLFVRILVLWGC